MSNSIETTFGTAAESSRPSVEVPLADDPVIGIDQIFEILKNKRRRFVLRYLAAAEEQVRLSELAEQIAAWENEKEVSQITSQERKRVYVGLYQCHLPKMDDMGVIEFNKPRGIVEPGENIDLVRQYLPADEHRPAEPFRGVHVQVALLSVLLVSVLGVLELFTPMGLLQPATLFIVGVIALVSVLPFAR